MQRILIKLQDQRQCLGISGSGHQGLAEAGYSFAARSGVLSVSKSPIADDVKFVNVLLQENILGVPGTGFGTPGHFRLAYCVADRVIEGSFEGFRRAIRKVSGKASSQPVGLKGLDFQSTLRNSFNSPITSDNIYYGKLRRKSLHNIIEPRKSLRPSLKRSSQGCR
jgi:hypothetical protein